MSRNDLTPEAVAELAALDAILAGGPVADDHLELAALVDSVRSVSPRRSDEFTARLDERFERRRSARPRRASLRAPRAAWAGGSLAALVVAVAVVVGSGVLNGSKPGLSDTLGHGRSAAPAIALPGSGGGGALPRSNAGATSSGTAHAPTGATGTTSPGFTLAPSIVERNTNPSHRLVARGAALTLASSPAQMQTVANEVVSNTERFGGIVESSSVDVHGLSSYASFSLSVPSTHLPALISSLSALAGVRALDQSSSDITDSYDQASAQLADEKAQRAALIRALAAAGSLSAEQAIQQKINRLNSEIIAATKRVGALVTRGDNAKVSVVIVASAAAAAASGSGGPVNRALNDALKVLDVALAVALVALAIVLPIALVTLATWWGAATLRRRSREHALEARAG